MPTRTIQQFQIFLASPGDVSVEREHVRTAVLEVNRTLGKDRGFILTPVGWDTDARPGYGGDPQSQINETIAKMAEYELFVGIMWNRFGTRTERAESGTEEEFNRAAESHATNGNPQIMLYFGQMGANLRTLAELEQKQKVLSFRERVGPHALTWQYDDPAQFAVLFRRHLESWILSRLQEQPPAPPPATSASSVAAQRVVSQTVPKPAPVSRPPATSVDSSGSWVLLGDNFFLSESVVNSGDGTAILELIPQNSTETAALSAMRQNNRQGYQRNAVSFAHGDDASIVRVADVQSKSAGGRTVWTITLKIEEVNTNSMMEMVINNTTPDAAAELKAKLLLLNEAIEIPGPRAGNRDMTASMIMGSMKVQEGIFPSFWQRYQHDPGLFLPLARLWAIYILKVSNVCEYILDLKLELVENNSAVNVNFRGRRKRPYSNVPPTTIQVSGRCALL